MIRSNRKNPQLYFSKAKQNDVNGLNIHYGNNVPLELNDRGLSCSFNCPLLIRHINLCSHKANS